MARGRGATIDLVIPVPFSDDRWVLEDEGTPETPLHELIIGLLVDVLRTWIARTQRDAMAGSNIALRWNRAKPSVGVDPDVYLVEPAPPLGERETSLCLWKKGHHAPRVAVEVVSEGTADKDYSDGPSRYAAATVRELWIFDPLGLGPAEIVVTLQVWRRVVAGRFERVYAGDGPAFSRELGAWLVVTDDGMRLRIADDAAGSRRWPTAAEAERAAHEAERAARIAAEAELERLRATLSPGPPPRRPRRA